MATTLKPPAPRYARMSTDRGRTFTVRFPEYGHLEAVIAFGLVALVVDRATPVLAGPLAALAGTTPARVRLGFAGLLWITLFTAVLVSARRQRRGRAPEFRARDVLVKFLEQNRVDRDRYVVHAVGASLGGVVVALGYTRFVDALDGAIVIVRRVVAGDPVGSAALASIAAGVAFFGGLVLFAIGLDRFLVDLAREALYRYHRGRL